jgi:ABC-type phosphate transport system substrate-binding protein
MQQFLFLIGLLAILFGLFSMFKSKINLGLFSIVFGGTFIGIAYLLAYFENTPPVVNQKEFSIKIVGSRTIGQSLMPNLVKQYLSDNQFHIFEQVEKPDYLRISAQRKKEENLSEILHIEIQSLGSKKGFESLKEGNCDIAMASSQLPEEIATALGLGFNRNKNEHIIAFDALRIIVHPSVQAEIDGIKLSVIEQILQGKITNWSKISPKKKGEIYVSLRDSNSGT